MRSARGIFPITLALAQCGHETRPEPVIIPFRRIADGLAPYGRQRARYSLRHFGVGAGLPFFQSQLPFHRLLRRITEVLAMLPSRRDEPLPDAGNQSASKP